MATAEPSELRDAYQRRLPEIVAVTEDELVPVNIDVHAAVTTVVGAYPEIAKHRDAMVALAGVNEHLVDGLRDYALAAGLANSLYTTAMTPHDDIVALNAEALKLRETLRSDAVALSNRGLIDPARLAPLKGTVGYRNVAFELIDYATLLSGCWDKIQNKTAMQKSEVDHALKLGEQLMFAVGEREQAPAVIAEASKIRQQAFTLFWKAYSEVRRALQFLRFYEDDLETIAPSLYQGRGGRGKTSANADEAPADGGTADQAAKAAGTRNAPVAAQAAAAAAAPPIPPGMPGASPFLK